MPPGIYMLILSLLSISIVNARKSERERQNEWPNSNTMSRDSGENQGLIDIDNNQGYNDDRGLGSSGYGQHDDGGSGLYDDDDDDDDYDDEENFSGTPGITIGRPPKKPRTKCEEVRDSVIHVAGAFVPRCNSRGEYNAVQCDLHSSECYCVTKYGQEIPFTRGRNVQESTCTGYDRGSQFPVTRRPGVGAGARPETDDKFVVVPSRPNEVEENGGIGFENPKQTETESESPIVIETVPKGEGSEELDEEENGSNSQGGHPSRSFIQTPGLLPGIIGGAVVGLLCAVLLVMFIVYRMRKKDEGSYALEEPKMTSPSRGYTRAPTKEYWA